MKRRLVIVTGGSMGLGREIARAFAERGDSVVITARNIEPLQKTAAEIETFSDQVVARACDVTDEGAVRKLVSETVARFKRIDVLVNNAGIYGPIGLSFENDSNEWFETIKANLFGVFLTAKHVAPVMSEQGFGSIINLSGGGATGPKPRYSAYAASKTALVRFTEILAHELAPHNIRVNAIAPGFIATRLHQQTIDAGDRAGGDAEKVKEKLKSGGDDPRLTAELSLFLASKKAEGITGRLISAVWDDWRSLSQNGKPVSNSDLFTIRRIDNVFYQEVPKA